jgi:two-component system phosphate regulon response regulator PhoB
VLVVEDDPDIRYMLAARLRSAGMCVTVVADARAALSATRQDRPDVIVLDVRLPGMNGLDLCRELRADPDLARIGVVVVTASVGAASAAAAYEAGADDFVTKPFSLAGLLGRVRSVASQLELTREPARAG